MASLPNPCPLSLLRFSCLFVLLLPDPWIGLTSTIFGNLHQCATDAPTMTHCYQIITKWMTVYSKGPTLFYLPTYNDAPAAFLHCPEQFRCPQSALSSSCSFRSSHVTPDNHPFGVLFSTFPIYSLSQSVTLVELVWPLQSRVWDFIVRISVSTMFFPGWQSISLEHPLAPTV